jgi:N-acetylglucosamine kinase-like BadF-type ATPase
MPSYLGIVGGCSGAFGIFVQDLGQNVIVEDDEKCGMDWRESRQHGDPCAGVTQLMNRIALTVGNRSFVYDGAAVAISGADPRYWPWFHQAALQHAGVDPNRTRISSLTEAAHWGAFRGGSGILVRCGHGSSTFASNAAGESVLMGGWGSVVGDHGGGAWMGRQALEAMCMALDHRASSDERVFVAGLLDDVGAPDAMELIERIERVRFYSGGFGLRKELFLLGVATTRMAEMGDRFAKSVTQRALEHLIEAAVAAHLHVGAPPEIPLALAGSVFSEVPSFATSFTERLSEVIHPTSIVVVGNAERSTYWSVTGIAMIAINKSERNKDEWFSNLFDADAVQNLAPQKSTTGE